MDRTSEPEDDSSILDSELLYRSIHPSFVKPGGTISSSAFISSTNPHVSVDRSTLSTAEESRQRRPKDAGIAQLLTGIVRSLTIGVASAPTPENRAHALIIRDLSMTHGQWKKVANELARACQRIIAPSSTIRS